MAEEKAEGGKAEKMGDWRGGEVGGQKAIFNIQYPMFNFQVTAGGGEDLRFNVQCSRGSSLSQRHRGTELIDPSCKSCESCLKWPKSVFNSELLQEFELKNS